VPAIIFVPSESIAFANCFASLSVANVLVCLAWVVNRRSLGDSTETNHRLVTARRAKMDVPSLLLNSAKILGCRLDRASMTNVPCTDDARSRPLRQLRCHHLLWQRQPSDTTPRLDHAFSAGTKICRASSSRVPTSISRQSLLKSISPKRLLSIVSWQASGLLLVGPH
jgi:hypothetical protein